jgi:hypothetical protein
MNFRYSDPIDRNANLAVPTTQVSSFVLRLRASFLHFCLSLIAASAGTLPFVLWLYPEPFLEAAGGFNLIFIICLVDLVMGPCLTFVVYNKAKKSLRKDLIIIASLQLIALFYGLYALAISRPVFLTYVVDRFEVVTYADIDHEELSKAPAEFRNIGWGNPRLAYAVVPKVKEEYENVMLASAAGVDLKRFLRYYAPITEAELLIRSKVLPLNSLYQFNEPAQVDLVLGALEKSAIGYVPVQGAKRDLAAIIDLKTGQLVKTVKLKPW